MHQDTLDRPAPTHRALKIAAAALGVLVLGIVLLAMIWDWNWFRGPLERIASTRLHRQVTISGDLRVRPWSWQPSATVDGITIANPKWAGRAPLGRIPRLAVRIRAVPLLWGRLDVRELRVVRPGFDLRADAAGRRNWDFSDGRKPQPMNLPPIHSFMIRDGRLTYVDARRKLRFEGAINAAEQRAGGAAGFRVTGQGTINGAPFRALLTGGPLLNVRRDRPYPFRTDIRAGATHITAEGAIPRPFDLGRFQMSATAQGPDMAQLFPLTGIALPNTPPYSLRGRVTREALLWRIDWIGGRVGDSDLAGRVAVQTGGERPRLTADLQSRNLDFDDLGTVFGGAPKAGPGETASPEQAAVARAMTASQRLFPDTRLDVGRIRAMDADVRYRALAIRDAPLRLNGASVRVRLDDGLLRADPLQVELPRGQIEGRAQLDARKATPVSSLDLRLTRARIENLIPTSFGGGPAVSGPLSGRARLTGVGDSVHKALASANGEVTVVASGGEIRKAFAELLGVNVVKGLGLLMKKDTDTTALRCGVAHFEARGGVLRADDLLVDTGPVLVSGKGEINLGSERMDLKVRGHDKKFRLVRVLLPVTMKGPLAAPKLGVEPGSAVAQGGVAAALGGLLSPLAAVLPFVDPGLAKDANCGALLTEARQQGAPTPVPAPKPLTARR